MYRQLLLLGLLRQEDMHGYRLNDLIERHLPMTADLKKPTAYYLLDKLAAEGALTEHEEADPDGNRPPRKTYAITEAGEKRFRRLLRDTLRSTEPPTYPIDTAVLFMGALDPEDARGLLIERRSHLEQRLDVLQRAPDHGIPLRHVFEHHIVHLQAELAWTNNLIDQLNDADEPGQELSLHD
jgi:DNA-binding PadR family transcriptional regulator